MNQNQNRIALLFVLINFCVAYVSDNVLNDLSKYSKIKAFSSLDQYFKNKSIVIAGVYAGLTVAIATIALMILYRMIFNEYLPTDSSTLTVFFVMAYAIGYALDVLIYKMNIFNNLQPFYNEVGAGNGGALSFLFSLAVSFGLLKIVKYLTMLNI
jgi:hypothetical protein